jgi:hypothetical protein
MEFSNHGALMQVFILQGLEQYAKSVAAKTPEQLDSPMVNGRAWHGCATELIQAINEHFERPKPKTLAELERKTRKTFATRKS